MISVAMEQPGSLARSHEIGPFRQFGLRDRKQRKRYLQAGDRGRACGKRLHQLPHVLRHTTAVHLLRAGVDINTIRAWLGHVSLDTTNVYAEVDLEMKARALSEPSR